MGRIKEIMYEQVGQPAQYQTIRVQATAIVNEGEDENAALAHLRNFVLKSLNESIKMHREATNGTPVAKTASVPQGTPQTPQTAGGITNFTPNTRTTEIKENKPDQTGAAKLPSAGEIPNF